MPKIYEIIRIFLLLNFNRTIQDFPEWKIAYQYKDNIK